MKTDHDGLARSQIQRIDRLQMTRYRKQKRKKSRESFIIIGLFCLWLAACFIANGLIEKERLAKNELTTSLPTLDNQAPTITIHADRD